jgi:hypothetical protein
MRLIAHRGLMHGPDPKLENHPEQIYTALMKGFDVEVDVWLVNEEWWFGHDRPQYRLADYEEFYVDYRSAPRPDQMWFHCKNVEALEWALTEFRHNNYFWHQSDDYTVTSRGLIWAYPGKPLTRHSVCVMPEWQEGWRANLPRDVWGICSDYVADIKETLG